MLWIQPGGEETGFHILAAAWWATLSYASYCILLRETFILLIHNQQKPQKEEATDSCPQAQVITIHPPQAITLEDEALGSARPAPTR